MMFILLSFVRDCFLLEKINLYFPKKNNFYSFLIFVIILSLIPRSILHASELRVSTPSSIIEVGDTIVIDFILSDVIDLFGAGFDLAYDSDKLEYIDAAEGSFLNSNEIKNTIFLVTNDVSKGVIIAGITRSNYYDGGVSSQDDDLLTSFRFYVKVADSISLIITRSSLTTFSDNGLIKFPHSVVNGYIVSQISTTVDEIRDELIAASVLEVGSNYPNPFNSTTIINCRILSKCHGDVFITNILGQRITTLFSGTLHSGDYSFSWDKNDCNYQTVTTGIYLFVFRFEGQTITRKAVYLK